MGLIHYVAVWWIRDILVRIRMRIREAQKQTYGTLVHFHHSSKIKIHKEVTKSRNKGFSDYFCLMMEGFQAGPGSELLNNGSGCGTGTYGCGSGTLLYGIASVRAWVGTGWGGGGTAGHFTRPGGHAHPVRQVRDGGEGRLAAVLLQVRVGGGAGGVPYRAGPQGHSSAVLTTMPRYLPSKYRLNIKH